MKPTHTHNYLPCNSAHLDHTKNNIPYNQAKEIIVFVSDTEKVVIRFDELRQFLKNCKHLEHVMIKNIVSAELQGPALNPKRNKNLIPFATAYYPHIDHKSLMQTMKNKLKNTKNEQRKIRKIRISYYS